MVPQGIRSDGEGWANTRLELQASSCRTRRILRADGVGMLMVSCGEREQVAFRCPCHPKDAVVLVCTVVDGARGGYVVIEPATMKASTSVENGTASEEQIGGAVALASWNDGRRPQRASWKPMVSTLRRRVPQVLVAAVGTWCVDAPVVSSIQHASGVTEPRPAS